MKKLFTLLVFLPLFSNAQIITTFAGSMATLYGGDGGSATTALLNMPSGVAVDASGNMYIADQGNNRVRKVSASGVITTIAGVGYPGSSGDGGPATNAPCTPAGIALDGAGNVYIADRASNCVRKINTSGIISKVAGNGVVGFTGDGVAATATALSAPSAVAVDGAGNIYIADAGNSRIRKVNTSGIITTVAGMGASTFGGDGGAATDAALHNPTGIALDAAGNIYIADELNARIRKINTSGIISTIAGDGTFGFGGDGGAATAAEFYQPYGVAVDASGNVFVADQVNNRLRKINTSGIITTVGGSAGGGFTGDAGPATAARLSMPSAVAVDATGNMFIADQNNNRIRRINPAGMINTVAGNGIAGHGDGGPATAAQLSNPNDVTFDAIGNVYICDVADNVIRKVNPAGIITTIAGNGMSGYTGDGGPATNASMTMPAGIAVDNYGNLYICDDGLFIRKVDAYGIITTVAGVSGASSSGDGGPATDAGLNAAQRIAIDLVGNLYFSDGNHSVRKINTAGIISTVAGGSLAGYSGDGGPATAAGLSCSSVAVDNAGNLYISDIEDQRIRKVDVSGIITTVAGNGTAGYSGDGGPATDATLNGPGGIAVDNAGNLYISDEDNQAVRKVDAAGIITTITGDGTAGYSGDGGPATAAEIWAPVSARPDNMGHLYIADFGNNVIRKITGLPATPFYLASIAGPDTVCIGASLSFSDSTAYGAWSSGSAGVATVGTDGTVTGVSAGATTITYTDGGTYTTATINVISCTTEAQSLSSAQNRITLYPNPATTQLTIGSSDQIKQVVISNLLGQVVFSHTCYTHQAEINISNLPAGVYFVKTNGTDVRKFVKE